MASNRQQRAARSKLAARRPGLLARLAAVASLLTLAACQTPPVNSTPVPETKECLGRRYSVNRMWSAANFC